MEKTILIGTYGNTIRKNFRTGNTFFTFICRDFDEYKTRGKIYCAGYVPVITKGIPLKLTGNFHENENQKYIFKLDTADLYSDENETTIEYLKSDRFKGIGQKTAQKIVEFTGSDIFSFIKQDNAAELLSENIKELKGDKSQKFIKTIEDTFFEKRVFDFIKLYGGDYTDAQALCCGYGVNAIEKIKESPYEVGKNVDISFIICDAIAKENHFFALNEARLKYLIVSAFYQLAQDGHTYAEIQDIYDKVSLISKQSAFPETEFPCSVILCHLNKIGIIKKDKNAENKKIYILKEFLDAEETIAQNVEVINNSKEHYEFCDEEEIKRIENKESITYSDKQKQAFSFLHSSGIKILTGGPGTGKTTVINGLIDLYKKLHPSSQIELCAPTGRAAQKIKDTTGHSANTIHRLLNIKPYETHSEENYDIDKINADLIIVDEMSMVDLKTFAYLTNAVKPNATIILCGDTFQLPSVNAGNVLHDLINTNIFETVMLDVIYRQGEDSDIVLLSHDIKNGEMDKKWTKHTSYQTKIYGEQSVQADLQYSNKKVQIIKVKSANEIYTVIMSAIKKKFLNKNSKNYVNDVLNLQVLSPTKKDIAGVTELNKTIHYIYHDEEEDGDLTFSVGDKIIMTENNYDIGYYNGDIGFIQDIDEEKKMIVVKINDKEMEIPEINAKKIALAYAITIHKSQGSEYDYVIIALPKAGTILQRNLIYTAITRAKKYAAIIYEEDALSICIRSNDIKKRKTNLTKKILEYKNRFTA